jgi:NADPH:quinone reductase-like Zn-dependent oxidoreductase
MDRGWSSMKGAGMPRAVHYTAFAGPENLHVGEVESMPMGPDSVQIEVAGAGINPVD